MQVRDLIAELQRFNQFDEVAIDTDSADGHVAIERVEQTRHAAEFAGGNKVYVSLIAGEPLPAKEIADMEMRIEDLERENGKMAKELEMLRNAK